MSTAAADLRTLITTWPDLCEALGTPGTIGGLGRGLRGYLATLEQYDLEEAAALRALERNPAQLGQRPAPVQLRILETKRTIEAALAECADQTAAAVQIEPIPFPTRNWPAADRARRTTMARADLADPRRWRFRGTTPRAPYTALWLLARVEHRPGPCRRLTDQHHQHIANVAREAVHRIEAALDTVEQRRELGAEHPCPCGGVIEVYGGAGATPCARCTQCGALWSEEGVIAA